MILDEKQLELLDDILLYLGCIEGEKAQELNNRLCHEILEKRGKSENTKEFLVKKYGERIIKYKAVDYICYILDNCFNGHKMKMGDIQQEVATHFQTTAYGVERAIRYFRMNIINDISRSNKAFIFKLAFEYEKERSL